MDGERKVEGTSNSPDGRRYVLAPARISPEDIIFCIDVGRESMVEMKGTKEPVTRLDAIKHSILIFINAKLSIDTEHRFAFAALSSSAAWIKREFTNNANSAFSALESLSAAPSSDQADLTDLFTIAGQAAKRSRAQSRILRVILIYCRSSVMPYHQWPANQKLFTLDVMYLHDKPGPDNWPQKVYDVLVDAVEQVSEYEGFTYESGQNFRGLLRQMSMLLCHPQQRVLQEHMGIPKSISKVSSVDSAILDESSPVTTQ